MGDTARLGSASGDFGAESTQLTEQWRRILAERLQPLDVVGAAEDFVASVAGGEIDQVRFARIRTSPHTAERTDRLAASGDPHYWVAYQCAGTSTIEQSGHRAVLRPGDFTVYDSSMPYRRDFPEDSDTLVLLIPQQRLHLPPRAIAALSGVRIDGDAGLGAVVSAFLGALAEQLESLTADAGFRLVRGAIDLITSALAEQLGVLGPSPSQRHIEQLRGVRDWIIEHLDDPSLTPAAIARATFVSTRQLHLLFEEQGTTVGTWVRERRLDMARRDLESPGEPLPIRDIAAHWGFADPGHFARAFRALYGVTPRVYRERARSDRA